MAPCNNTAEAPNDLHGTEKKACFDVRGSSYSKGNLSSCATHPMIMGKSCSLNLRFRMERMDMLITAWIME